MRLIYLNILKKKLHGVLKSNSLSFKRYSSYRYVFFNICSGKVNLRMTNVSPSMKTGSLNGLPHSSRLCSVPDHAGLPGGPGPGVRPPPRPLPAAIPQPQVVVPRHGMRVPPQHRARRQLHPRHPGDSV